MEQSTFYPSIFNDVLAPATQGPSSSNTAGVFSSDADRPAAAAG